MKSIVATSGSFTLFLAAVSTLVVSAPTLAQQAGLEEIVVTAQYREENLQETPLAITAITGADIEVRAFTESYELGYTVPNASLRPAQAAFGNTMTAFIRGIGQNDFDFAFEPGVGIYVDDVYHPFTLGSDIHLLDLERVEVLRGPQGTLYGRGSIGGAIRYVTKKPQGDETGKIELTTGRDDRVDIRANYDFSITENLFARVAGVSRSRDGYQDVIDFACAFPAQAGPLQARTINRGKDCKIGTQGGENVTGVRGDLRWEATDDFELTVTADYQNDDSEAKADTITVIDTTSFPSLVAPPFATSALPYDQRFLPPNIYTTYATYDDPLNDLAIKPESTLDKWSISGHGKWQINDDVAATAILAYTDLETTLATDADGSPINMQTVDGVQTVDFFQAELRFSGRWADKLDWTIGGFYYDGNSLNEQMVSIPFLSLVVDGVLPTDASQPFVNAHNDHDSRNWSGFGHFVYDFNDQLALTGGVRYSDDEKKVDFDNTRVQNPFLVVEDHHFDWKAGLDYKLNEDLLLYASAATGYRPGSYNPRPFQWTGVVAVDAEESLAYEGGFKSDWFDRKFRLNVAGFYTNYKTRILPVGGTECLVLNGPPGPPVYLTVPAGTIDTVTGMPVTADSIGNLCDTSVKLSRTFYQNGPADIWGAEVEATVRPVDALTITGAFGYTHWKSDDIQGNAAVQDDYPVYVPELNWTVSASYDIGMGNGSMLTPRVDVYGQSDICTTITFDTTEFPEAGCSDGYELVNVRLQWTSPEAKWIAAFGMTNLFDEEYFLNKFNLTAFGQPAAEGQPGRYREWYFTVGRNF
jgi:iron complex outermembrane receptor protein